MLFLVPSSSAGDESKLGVGSAGPRGSTTEAWTWSAARNTAIKKRAMLGDS